MSAKEAPNWPLCDALKVARGVVDDEVGVIEGSIALAGYAHYIVPDWRVDADFVVFGALSSETDHLPFGSARERWSAPGLVKADTDIQRIAERWRAKVRQACENVMARFLPAASDESRLIAEFRRET